MFRTIDGDKNGFVNSSEFFDFFRQESPILGRVTLVELQKEFDKMDTSKDGVIQPEEFDETL